MGPKQCQVCSAAVSKYKCPLCLAPYCSLICFKKHKEIPCSVPAAVTSEQNEKSKLPCSTPWAVTSEENEKSPASAPTQSLVERPINVDEASMVLQRSQLEAIASSSEIRDALKDENLRKLIRNIDSSHDVEIELDKAIGLEEFCAFAKQAVKCQKKIFVAEVPEEKLFYKGSP